MQLTAELVEEVLERDFANIMAKAQAGKPLTKRERDLLEGQRARLGSDEQTSGTLGADYLLEGEAGPLAGLTLEEFSERYGYSVRALKKWRALGRDLKDAVPLEWPERMAAWFERTHPGRAAPDRLTAAVQRLRVEEEKPRDTRPSPRIEIEESEKGLDAMLRRARDNEARLYRKYQAAVDSGSEADASFLGKQWTDATEKLRALEKTAPQTLEALGIYVRKDDVRRELSQLHSAILKNLSNQLRNARLELGQAKTQAEWNAKIAELLESVRQDLVSTEFAEPLEMSA